VDALFGGLLPDEHDSAIQPDQVALLMIHGRTSPSGQERLVCVGIKGDYQLHWPSGHSLDKPLTEVFVRRLSIVAAPCVFTTRRNRPRPDAQEDGISVLEVRRGSPGQANAYGYSGLNISPGVVKWTPAGSGQPGRLSLEAPGLMRLYAGQPGPKDASHFTIAYEIDGRKGKIDGWLRDNGSVDLKPDGGAVFGRVWKPLAPPATGPAGPATAPAGPSPDRE
jgi:hypothetical protein